MGGFGTWIVGLFVLWLWWAPNEAGRWLAKIKASYEAERTKRAKP